MQSASGVLFDPTASADDAMAVALFVIVHVPHVT